MKLSRLWQPRNPAFWLMVALNLLSTVLAWITRSFELAPAAALMVAGFAVASENLTGRSWRTADDTDSTP